MMKKTASIILKIIVAAAVLGLIGTAIASRLKDNPAALAAASTPPPASVTVRTLQPEKTRVWTEFSGRMQAVDYAEIRPQVSGRITDVRFKDGQNVKAGDILFVIDPRPYQAAVDRDQANVVSASSKLELAKLDQQRAQTLIVTHAIAQSDLDRFNDEERSAEAALDAVKADLAQAQVDLEHAYVAAPISGRVSRVEITLGNLVQSGPNAPVLTSIVSNDGIYADFEVDEQTYLQIVRASAQNGAPSASIPVQVLAQGDENHSYYGVIESFDNRIDTASGTIRARAKFDNQDGALIPGMFVTVKLGSSSDVDVLLIPSRALGFDQSKRFVYVVDSAGKVAYREVELGPEVGNRRIVEKGLVPGDRVITDGIQHVNPGDVVAAHEAPMDNNVTTAAN
ncbi:MAG TPA: efflux RND transporter periplasmic adaptor subunit, partial [Candidatus Methylacidiphilales bacterium]|nr:efflux RND transporter periplasmic adaptor subunit [Candidatus Methylacidiphilales bacterium]